jgi:polyketide cyclase/dehydrase/lipid transport protein
VTTLKIRARGPASKYEIWARYQDPARWPSWSPHIKNVDAEGPLTPRLEGELETSFGARARFEVLEVDDPAMRWTWKVRLGPASLEIEHDVSEGYAAVTLHGAAPVVFAYAPFARRALRRLVAA